jgi:5-oxoprolinase (ATP-hydrolysing)
MGDHTRPDLFALDIQRPDPLCAGVMEVDYRIDAEGLRVSLNPDLAGEPESPAIPTAGELERWRSELVRWHRRGLRAVAVVLVHGPLLPDAEDRLGDLCRKVGFEQVSIGHQVAPSRGFLWRLYTTLADAALSPLLPRAPGEYMKSDGGLALQEQGRTDSEEWRGAQAVLSGPAGGVVATAELVRGAGGGQAFGLDMGGTSTDVCRVAGEPERTDHLEVGGVVLRVPSVRLETVAAGGGSVLGIQGGIYTVGPRSAGSNPGPAAYGRGGPATVTDAEVVLGRLPSFPRICGHGRDEALDIEAARKAVKSLDPDRPVEEVAWSFRRLAAENMARAIRGLAAQLGVDPADHRLVAFGGAGPAHGCAVAELLGMDTVLVPRLASVFSAVGIGRAPRRAERVAPILTSVRAAMESARERLPFEGVERIRLAARHLGTRDLIEIPIGIEDPNLGVVPGGLPPEWLSAFHRAHLRRFGFERPGLAVEAVEVRVSVQTARPQVRLGIEQSPAPRRSAPAWFGRWREVPVVSIEQADGLVGPVLLVGQGMTVVVEPGWSVCSESEHVRLDRSEHRASACVIEDYHPLHTAVLGTRVMAIAEQMGERLARLARSVNIRERRDFSCAVFDAEGRLLANAPHIPVHLGAMGETVRDLLARRGDVLAPEQAWACNDPYAGGSHLPDITVMAPVYLDGRIRALVACRGHHVDVGGITPGSMPPHARTLDEEGLLLRQICIARGARFIAPELPGCREPDVVLADLQAQVAACSLGIEAVTRLAKGVGVQGMTAQFDHLHAHAARCVRDVLASMGGTHEAVEVLDDGVRIHVRLEIESEGARVQVRAPAHSGNLNAPRSVARAALLYVFRCLVQEPVPLNEGSMEPLSLDIESGGLFDPVHPRAVAGGNVETSQRLVDGLLRALGVLASSQGTMNNLTIGTSAGTWYETLAGGSGAGPGFGGAHAVQVHMTNTRATDVEELEARFPVRLLRLSRRVGSGGEGVSRGGDGLVKEWLFLERAEVSLLAGRREAGAPGLAGGGPGLPGLDERNRGAGWERAPESWTAEPGHRLRISTPGGGGHGGAGAPEDQWGAV